MVEWGLGVLGGGQGWRGGGALGAKRRNANAMKRIGRVCRAGQVLEEGVPAETSRRLSAGCRQSALPLFPQYSNTCRACCMLLRSYVNMIEP